MAHEGSPAQPDNTAQMPDEFNVILEQASRIHAGLPEPGRSYAEEDALDQLERRPTEDGESVADRFCTWAAKELLAHTVKTDYEGVVREPVKFAPERHGWLGTRYHEKIKPAVEHQVKGWVLEETHYDRNGKPLQPKPEGTYDPEKGESAYDPKQEYTVSRTILTTEGLRLRVVEQRPEPKPDSKGAGHKPRKGADAAPLIVTDGESTTLGANFRKNDAGEITGLDHSKVSPSVIHMARLLIRNGHLEAAATEPPAVEPRPESRRTDPRQRVAEAQLAEIYARQQRDDETARILREAATAQTTLAEEAAAHNKRGADAAVQTAAEAAAHTRALEELLRRSNGQAQHTTAQGEVVQESDEPAGDASAAAEDDDSEEATWREEPDEAQTQTNGPGEPAHEQEPATAPLLMIAAPDEIRRQAPAATAGTDTENGETPTNG